MSRAITPPATPTASPASTFGVPPENAALGNALIAKLTGIDVRGRSSEAGYRLFDEWPQAQAGLLARLTQQPYVAHNATFEHSWFMLNVAGYAESLSRRSHHHHRHPAHEQAMGSWLSTQR